MTAPQWLKNVSQKKLMSLPNHKVFSVQVIIVINDKNFSEIKHVKMYIYTKCEGNKLPKYTQHICFCGFN